MWAQVSEFSYLFFMKILLSNRGFLFQMCKTSLELRRSNDSMEWQCGLTGLRKNTDHYRISTRLLVWKTSQQTNNNFLKVLYKWTGEGKWQKSVGNTNVHRNYDIWAWANLKIVFLIYIPTCIAHERKCKHVI